jgi:uncharacterized membrane protein
MLKTYAGAYVAAAVVFLALDGLWLGWIARDFYMGALGPLMRQRPGLAAAAAFYAIQVAGIVIFAVSPSLGIGWTRAALLGAGFGLCAYATYDLTNLAVLNGFPAKIALVDMAWGTFATAMAATAGHLAARWISG